MPRRDSRLLSIAAMTLLSEGYQPRVLWQDTATRTRWPRRSSRVRRTWSSSAAATAGSPAAAELARAGPVGGRARRARPRVGRQHPQRRHGAARAEGRPAHARAAARRAGPAAAPGGRGRLRPRRGARRRRRSTATTRAPASSTSPTPTRGAAHLDALGRRARRPSGRRPTSCAATTLAAEIGSTAFAAGLVVERSGGLHPARFHAGLVARRGEAGASLHPHTPATARRAGGPTAGAVRTSRGDDRRRRRAGRHQRLRRLAGARAPPAGAADGLVHHRHRAARRRTLAEEVLPDRAHVLQRPQPALVLAARRRRPHGVRRPEAPRPRDRSTRRATTSTGRCSRSTRSSPASPVERAWGGDVALTLDRLPHCGRIDGLWYATGCNGSGVALNTWLGHRMAGAICGEPLPALRRARATARSPCTRSGGRGCRWCRPGSASRTGERDEDPRGRQRRRRARPSP